MRSGAGPKMWRATTGRGRAGQAFLLREPSMVDGTTADSLAADQRAATGWPGRQVKAPRKEPPADSGPEPPGQRESAFSRNRPLAQLPAPRRNARKGGLDVPATHAGCDSLHSEHPIQTWTRRMASRTGRIRIFVFHPIARSLNEKRLPMMHQPVDQGRGQGVVHIEQDAPFPEGSIRA